MPNYDNDPRYKRTEAHVVIRELVPDPETGSTVEFFKTDEPCTATTFDGETFEITNEAFQKSLIVTAPDGRRFVITTRDVMSVILDTFYPDAPENEDEPAPAQGEKDE